MAAQSHSQLVDRIISQIASHQHGVVERSQLLAAGITRHQIAHRIRAGRLVEIHRGVYLVGAVAPPHAHEMAALLAYNLEATLSHRSAAALWNLLPYPASAPVWVTIPPERSATRPRIKAIRALLESRDIRQRQRLALTSPPRTILDLATELGAGIDLKPGGSDRLGELECIVAEAAYRKLASEAELRDQLERNPHKRGVVALRSVLELPGGPRRTRSPGERALLRCCASTASADTRQTPRLRATRSTFSGARLGSWLRSTATTRTLVGSRSSATV